MAQFEATAIVGEPDFEGQSMVCLYVQGLAGQRGVELGADE